MRTEHENEDQVRQTLYEPLKEALVKVKNVVEFGSPETWGFGTAKRILRLERCVDSFPPEAQEYLKTLFPQAMSILRNSPQLKNFDSIPETQRKESIGTAAQNEMYNAYDLMVHEIRNPELPHSSFITFDELVKMDSESFRLSHEVRVGGGKTFWVKSNSRNEWFPIALPITDRIIKKGGEARTILKKLARGPEETIENEFPFNDSDGIAVGQRKDVLEESITLGIDSDGLEMVKEMDIPRLLNSRDLDINATLVTKDGLFYTEDAFKAARTGHVKLYTNDRGIFGPIVFYYDQYELATNRGLGRLMKTVAEGKALSFDFLPLNQNIDFGIYWLIFARKYRRKFHNHRTRFGIMMQKLYYLGKQAGQIRPNEHRLLDTLERAHDEHPNFDFDDPKLNEVGVARWLNRYLYKSILRYYRQVYQIPRNFNYERSEGDNIPYIISLNGFEPDFDQAAEITQNWETYLDRCRKRRIEFLKDEDLNKVV
ncbi:MAG TPA: hypothetical protein VMR19_01775 [Candidatus Saccharimonadales bacterium]|jgi:hypothetical protein|nr:hypothetical protein [Candidatus Saccharimonadales bacterium]